MLLRAKRYLMTLLGLLSLPVSPASAIPIQENLQVIETLRFNPAGSLAGSTLEGTLRIGHYLGENPFSPLYYQISGILDGGSISISQQLIDLPLEQNFPRETSSTDPIYIYFEGIINQVGGGVSSVYAASLSETSGWGIPELRHLGSPVAGLEVTGNLVTQVSPLEANNLVGTWEVKVVAPSAVPEPSTMLLFCGGLTGLALWKRRKKV